jgi:hypothetical protein
MSAVVNATNNAMETEADTIGKQEKSDGTGGKSTAVENSEETDVEDKSVVTAAKTTKNIDTTNKPNNYNNNNSSTKDQAANSTEEATTTNTTNGTNATPSETVETKNTDNPVKEALKNTKDGETVPSTNLPSSVKLTSPAPQQPTQPLSVAGLITKKQVKDSNKTSIGNAAFIVQTERAQPSGKKYYGVSFMYKIGRWRATLYIRGGKTKQLGVYKNAKKAALEYDKAARAEYGSIAKVNFDEEGRPTDQVTFAYGGLHGEHQTVEITPNLAWPRVGDEFQVDMTQFSKPTGTTQSSGSDSSNNNNSTGDSDSQAVNTPSGTWHHHPINNPDEDDNAGYADTHYGSLHPDPLPHDSETNISKLWTPAEKAAFERAIFEVDKDFYLISKYVETKSYRSCVEYYYCVWKLMRGCQKWKKGRDDVIAKFQQEEQKRLTDLNRITTPGRTVHGNKMNGVAEEYQRMLIAAQSENNKSDSNGETSVAAEDHEKYCLCRGPGVGMMVACEKCENWFHGACVGLGTAEDRLKEGDEFVCGDCTENGYPQFSSATSGHGRATVSLADEVTVIWNCITKSALPKVECPKVRDLVKFLQNNPDFRPYYGDSDEEEDIVEDDAPAVLEEEEEEEEKGVPDTDIVWEKMLRCPPYEKKEGPGVKKSRARTKILKFCKRLEPWIEFNSSSEDSESSEEESSAAESSEEESSGEESSEDDEEKERHNEFLAHLKEQELGYDLLPLSLDPYVMKIQKTQQQQQHRNALAMQQQNPNSNYSSSNNTNSMIRHGNTGSSVFSDRFLMARQQVVHDQQQHGNKRGRKRQREVPIVPRSSLPQGQEPWHRFAPWNGGEAGKASKVEKRETVIRVKTLVERIQAHRVAVAIGNDTLKVQRRRIERLHGKPRVKRIKTGSDSARTFTPKQFQTLMWQLWVTNNFIKKNQVPPAYAMHEAGGSGRQYRWSGLRCRSIGLIDGAIVASSPRNFEVYKSQIIDLPLNTFNMPPTDINTLMQA